LLFIFRRTKTPIKVFKTPKSRSNSANNLCKDPVQVFCRVRPIQCESDLTCLKVTSSSTVLLTPPEFAINYKVGNLKETQFVFKHVFDMSSQQREVNQLLTQTFLVNFLIIII